MTDEEKNEMEKDILFQIDMQLYDEFNDTIATMNDHLGDIYSLKDVGEVEKAEKEKEIKLLREAVKKLQSDIEIKDKVIDELIMLLLEFDIDEIYCAKIKDCFEVADGKCFDCIKQYFYKKAEGKDE